MKYVQLDKINLYHEHLKSDLQKMTCSAIKDKIVFKHIMSHVSSKKDAFLIEIGVGGGDG